MKQDLTQGNCFFASSYTLKWKREKIISRFMHYRIFGCVNRCMTIMCEKKMMQGNIYCMLNWLRVVTGIDKTNKI